MRGWRRSAMVVTLCAAAAAMSTGTATAGNGAKPPTLEFLGQAIIPTGTLFDGTVVGGLSSITYDAHLGKFYVLSDDQAQFSPARFYTLVIDVSDGQFDSSDIEFLDVTTLLPPAGEVYAPGTFDPEGLTLARSGELIVTSEGIANTGIAPWVRRYALNGTYLGDLPVPNAFVPGSGKGVRQNLGFEAAAVAPDGRHLFVGMEGALVQDGPAATLTNGSRSRILRYNLSSGRLDRQYVYVTDPIAQPPVPPTAFAVSGLVEILPLNPQFMITMERSFSVGAPTTGNTGNSIKLYYAALPGAENVNGADSIAGMDGRTVEKTLLFDLDTIGIPLDNVEGMVLGPKLPDGRQSLILVSDNNFAAAQFTQFLLFAID